MRIGSTDVSASPMRGPRCRRGSVSIFLIASALAAAAALASVCSVVAAKESAPDLPSAIGVVRRQMNEMPGRLQSDSAKREGERRVEEMRRFLEELSRETSSLKAI